MWHRDNGLVRLLVDNEPWEPSVRRLSVAQQEVLCSEVMRTDQWAHLKLPRLVSLLLPTGRTLKDIDIYGLDSNGNNIVYQVTNAQHNSSTSQSKIERLKQLASPSATLILICDAKKEDRNGEVIVFALKEALRLFNRTVVGEKWINAGAPPAPGAHYQ